MTRGRIGPLRNLAGLVGEGPVPPVDKRREPGYAAALVARWRQLVFVSTRHEGKPQLFLIDVAGGEARRLTNVADWRDIAALVA